jgi:hypothetical protein
VFIDKQRLTCGHRSPLRADHHIMADIALFALDNPPPSTICLMCVAFWLLAAACLLLI